MLGEYQREWLRPDVLAGLTTAAVISTATTIAVLTGSALGLTLPAAPAWLDTQAGGFAAVIVHFILLVILTAVLYSGGESWAAWARGFGRRLADEHGERMVLLAGGAIRGVAMGVVVTAIMFALCIAQLGPLLVLLSAAAWVYYSAGAGWGTFMLVWALAVGLMDNFARPILIRRGADLPPLLIFAGVIGGLVAFGIVGIFVGPVVLAVSYTLLDSWVAAGEAAHEAAPRTTGTP